MLVEAFFEIIPYICSVIHKSMQKILWENLTLHKAIPELQLCDILMGKGVICNMGFFFIHSVNLS